MKQFLIDIIFQFLQLFPNFIKIYKNLQKNYVGTFIKSLDITQSKLHLCFSDVKKQLIYCQHPCAVFH